MGFLPVAGRKFRGGIIENLLWSWPKQTHPNCTNPLRPARGCPSRLAQQGRDSVPFNRRSATIRNSMRWSSGNGALSLAIAACTSAAQRNASTTLANSTSKPRAYFEMLANRGDGGDDPAVEMTTHGITELSRRWGRADR
jgi:hypothetical protein